MLSADRPSSFVSPSLNDIILKSPSHPFSFIATTSLSPSLLQCIPPLIPSFKSSDDLSAMGSLVNWCDNGRRLHGIPGQSCRQRWGRRSGTVFQRAGAGVVATLLPSKTQSGRSVRLQTKCRITHARSAWGGGRRWDGYLFCHLWPFKPLR